MKRLLKIIFMFVMCFCVNVFIQNNAFSQDEQTTKDTRIQVFKNLEQDYFRLKNIDPEISDKGKWESLANKFELFFKKNEHLSESAVSASYVLTLYEELFKKYRDEKYLDKSFVLYNNFFDGYSNHYLADDILMKKGDLYLFVLKDTGKAKECYNYVIEHYANSDMAELAKIRIAALEKNSQASDNTIAEKIKNNGGDDKFIRSSQVIVIDPGHGGDDIGAKNLNGLLEKDVTLDMALKLEEILKKNTGFNVYLTRRTDKFVSLKERTDFANDREATLFISLHVNASYSKMAYGIETYYLDNANDKSSKKLAERENKSLSFEGSNVDDLQFMLSDLIQSAKQEESIILANVIQKEMTQYVNKRWNGIKNLGVKKAPFYVLVGAHMPCILIETLFIDNHQDAKKLSQEKFRKDLAYGLYVAILRFFDQNKKNS